MEEDHGIELETEAHLQIGDTTIIASAHYQSDGVSCFDKFVCLLKEKLQNQPCS